MLKIQTINHALNPTCSILKISWQWGRGAIRIIALSFLFLVLT